MWRSQGRIDGLNERNDPRIFNRAAPTAASPRFESALWGGTNTEMVNSVNGLDSIAVKVEARDTARIKGSLKTGTGACPGPGDTLVYCTATGNYTFDAAFVK